MRGILNLIVIFGILIFLTIQLWPIPLVILYLILVFIGSKGRKERASSKLASTLMPNEQIIASEIQHRVFGLFHRRVLIAITNSRIITISRNLLGGFDMKDIQWKDLDDAQISENVLSSFCGSNLSFKYAMSNAKAPTTNGEIKVEGVAVKVATQIYSQAQQEEQAWEEKRRVRDLEEKRAIAGGITLNAGNPYQSSAAASPAPVQQAMSTIYAEIEKVKNLLDMGAINDSEFQEMKAKILSRNS
jgi:Short C-terminal domain/Bacterial PH domain